MVRVRVRLGSQVPGREVPSVGVPGIWCAKDNGRKNNPENSFTAKVGEHIRSAYSMSAILSFKSIEYKHNVCRGKDFFSMFFFEKVL